MSRAQRLRKVCDRLQAQTRFSRADDERCDADMQSIDAASIDEGGDRPRSTFHEKAREATREQGVDDGRGRHDAARRIDPDDVDARRSGCVGGAHDKAPARCLIEAFGGERQPAGRIDDDPDRISAGHAANRQARIVGEHGVDADDDRIHMRAHAVQVIERGGSPDRA